MSARNNADRITSPSLIIHEEDDNNPGTYPTQSERLCQALKGHGKNCDWVTYGIFEIFSY